jgi:hypothetical protein
MAVRNAALKHLADAALCWMNRIWELPDTDVAAVRELAWQWLRAEKGLTEPRLTKPDLDRQLRIEPTAPDVRALIAMIVWGSTVPSATATLVDRLPQIQRYLLAHENKVGVRAVWLAWHAITRLAGNDSLGLARVRDRMLERLIAEGLRPEYDLPTFLRTAGHRDSARIREVQKHATHLHEVASHWCRSVQSTTQLYIDLTFAFGLARLGEVNACRERLTKAAERVAAKRKEKPAWTEPVRLVTEFLFEAYSYRIEQALLSRPHTGPLPAHLRDRLEREMPTSSVSRYGVDRILKTSHIVEPEEKYDPYWSYIGKNLKEVEKELLALKTVHDPKRIAGRIEHFYRQGLGKEVPSAEEQLIVVREGLMLAPRVGESFMLNLLGWAREVMDRLPPVPADPRILQPEGEMLERALTMAANYDRPDIVQQLLARFLALVQIAQRHVHQAGYVNAAFRQGLRALRKLGLRDDMARLIDSVARDALGDRTAAQRHDELTHRGKDADWPALLQTLLMVADGWLHFGWLERAADVLDEARDFLFQDRNGNRTATDWLRYCGVAATYATVLGHAPIEYALRRLDELFQRMLDPPNTRTSNAYYAELHLGVVEAVVLAIVSDDFALGPSARRWLEDDEYLVRRRLHRDHRNMMTVERGRVSAP